MAGKAHGNGDRRGDNTICGLGDRLRRLTAGICLITQTIFPVMAAAPTHINPAHSDTAASLILPNVKTIPYTLVRWNRHQRSRHALVSPLMNYVA